MTDSPRVTDLNARLDEIEAVLAWTPYPEVLKMQREKLADAAPWLVAALRAVLDTDMIRREIQAEIEDSTDARGHINHFDYLPDRCADRIHARVTAALVSA